MQATPQTNETNRSAELLVRMRGINKWYGGLQALKDVDVEIYKGEALGIVGDNGAGKSTLVKTLTGAVTADYGDIEVKGQRVKISHPRDSQALGIQAIYQDLSLVDTFDVAQNIFLGQEKMQKRFGLFNLLSQRDMVHEALEVLEKRLKITISNPYLPVSNLSGGQRQAIAIARALIADAELILMDEPTAAMGVEETELILGLVQSLKQDYAVAIVSHNLEHVLMVCDRLIVMRNGSLVGDVLTAETTRNEIVSLITGLH